MEKSRLNAFSDGVIAIIITIMVLEIKVPPSGDLAALLTLAPIFWGYVLSFLYVGIYWHNHHHMMHTVKHVTGGIMWANTHLLFWLSLVPFGTAWSGHYYMAAGPSALYGIILLMAAIAYTLLERAIIQSHGHEALLAKAIGKNLKGKISLLAYAAGIGLSFVHVWLAEALYFTVALLWIIPDRRIERLFHHKTDGE